MALMRCAKNWSVHHGVIDAKKHAARHAAAALKVPLILHMRLPVHTNIISENSAQT